MPNWCENELYINADKEEDMKELKSLLDETLEISKDNNCAIGLLNAIIEMPKALEDTKKGSDGDAENWYDWRVANWGTKWDVECYETTMEEKYMSFKFDSAYAPPTRWLEVVAQLFPKLSFTLKYDEPGMGFMGVAKGRGNIVDECIVY